MTPNFFVQNRDNGLQLKKKQDQVLGKMNKFHFPTTDDFNLGMIGFLKQFLLSLCLQAFVCLA